MEWCVEQIALFNIKLSSPR